MNGRIVVVGLLGLALGALRVPVVAAAKGPERGGGRATIPNTVAGIWHDVKAHEDELGTLIAGKNLENVHEVAFAIRDLVNALPAKFVADLAHRLDKSGDAKDQAGTEHLRWSLTRARCTPS